MVTCVDPFQRVSSNGRAVKTDRGGRSRYLNVAPVNPCPHVALGDGRRGQRVSQRNHAPLGQLLLSGQHLRQRPAARSRPQGGKKHTKKKQKIKNKKQNKKQTKNKNKKQKTKKKKKKQKKTKNKKNKKQKQKNKTKKQKKQKNKKKQNNTKTSLRFKAFPFLYSLGWVFSFRF